MYTYYKRYFTKGLHSFFKKYDFRNIKKTRGLLVAECEYYMIAVYTRKSYDFILVYFIDPDTRQIIKRYRTREIYVRNILQRIQGIHNRIMNRKINLYI